MEIFGDTVTVTLAPETEYRAVFTDQTTFEETEDIQTSDTRGRVTFTTPYSVYDGWSSFKVFDGNDAVVYLSSLDRVRPYATAAELVTYTGQRINTSQALEYERVARTLINDIVGYKFDFVRKNVTAIGNGDDTLWTNERVTHVYSVTLNDEIVWEEGDDPGTFYLGYVYDVDADCGWEVIPRDITDATCILVNDFACGTNRYANKYLRAYGDGTHNMTYYSKVYAGTGNLLVDNILSKYVLDSVRIKVM